MILKQSIELRIEHGRDYGPREPISVCVRRHHVAAERARYWPDFAGRQTPSIFRRTSVSILTAHLRRLSMIRTRQGHCRAASKCSLNSRPSLPLSPFSRVARLTTWHSMLQRRECAISGCTDCNRSAMDTARWIADRHGLELVGKLVWALRPAVRKDRQGYELKVRGDDALRLALNSAEAPPALIDQANVIVDGPSRLLEFLQLFLA